MKQIKTRYPLNNAGTDLDRASLYKLIDDAKYPNFLSDLTFSLLPLPEVAKVARVSVDILIDSALGMDALTPFEEYAVRCALGFIDCAPKDAETFYASQLNDYRFDEVDWKDSLVSLTKADRRKPLTMHPAYSVIAPYLTMKAADVPCSVVLAVIEWTDYAQMQSKRNIRRKPLKKSA